MPDREGSERIALLVLGVHRSGTSALTRVLSLLGAGLPKELLGPARGNDLGHWESQLLVTLDDEIMAAVGEGWSDPGAIPPAWFGTSQANDFVTRVAEVLDAEYGEARLIVIKDPRICRLAPLYLAALGRLHIAPRVILPLRFPGEVIRSIEVRDEIDPRTTELLWLRHIIEAENHSRACPRVWTDFSGLLTDWRGTVQRIAATLELDWPSPPDSRAAEIEATLAPDMRHFDQGSAAPVGPLARRIWEAARRGLIGDEAGLRAEFDAVRSMVDELDRLAAPTVENTRSSLAAVRSEIPNIRTALAAASVQSGRLQAEAVLRAVELDRLRECVSALESQVAAQTQALAERASQIEELAGEVREAVAAGQENAALLHESLAVRELAIATLQTRIDGLEASRSWRLTAPLRAVAQKLGRSGS